MNPSNAKQAGPIPEGPAIEKIQSRSKISIPARNFQSRSKFLIPIENFNPRVSIYGVLVVYREGLDRKFQSTIDRSKFAIPKAAIEFFQSPGPLGYWTSAACKTGGKTCPKLTGSVTIPKNSLLNPCHLKLVTVEPVGQMFEISNSNPIRGKCGKCRTSLSPRKNKNWEKGPFGKGVFSEKSIF